MISILIPVYNFDIRLLVNDLYQQLTEAGIPFEILCYDDGSSEIFKQLNRQLLSPSLHSPIPPYPPIPPSSHSPILYHELPQNLGRARIRNALAKAAQYPYLLFMDCDSKVVSPHYIQHYINHLQSDVLLYGGRSYAPAPPKQAALRFHWNYGTQREQIPSNIRQQHPYHAFMTNNFLIPKAIFEEIQFDERLTQYGHEDTLFGLELQQRQIKILHLDNPLEHIGLEDQSVFLQKTKQGIQNLAFLAKEHPHLETRLLKTHRKLQKIGLIGITKRILQAMQPFILQKLKAENPDLKWFDLYKLQLLIAAMKT